MFDAKLLRVAAVIAANLDEISDLRAPGRSDYYFYFRSRVFSVARGSSRVGEMVYSFAAYPKWTSDVGSLVSYIEHGYEDESMLALVISTDDFLKSNNQDYAERIFTFVHSQYIGLDDLMRDLGIN